jgi:hypothetical protein
MLYQDGGAFRAMPLYELLKKLLGEAERYIKEDERARSALKMIGKIKVNVKATDTNEQVGGTVGTDGVELFKEAIEAPDVTISGASKIMKDLVENPSRARLEEVQKKKLVKMEPHGLKGKLVLSKLKDALSGEK